MRNHDSVIDGWEVLTVDKAIDAAIDKLEKIRRRRSRIARSRRTTVEKDPSIGFGSICF